MIQILAECHYVSNVTFGLWHEPSVCCLSVTSLHPRQRLGNFSAIFCTAYNSSGTRSLY